MFILSKASNIINVLVVINLKCLINSLQMGVVCPGSCAQQPQTQLLTFNLLQEAKAGRPLSCPRCSQFEQPVLTDLETFLVSGKLIQIDLCMI